MSAFDPQETSGPNWGQGRRWAAYRFHTNQRRRTPPDKRMLLSEVVRAISGLLAIDGIPNCACHWTTDTGASAAWLGVERCCNFMGTPDRERCDVSGCLRRWVNHIS